MQSYAAAYVCDNPVSRILSLLSTQTRSRRVPSLLVLVRVTSPYRHSVPKAYIANSTTNFVVVFNTQTQSIVNSFSLPEHPQTSSWQSKPLVGSGEDQIFQIDATTGASTGPSISGYSGGVFIYSGSLEISPDRNTLYYGQYGLCAIDYYKIDVSGGRLFSCYQTPLVTRIQRRRSNAESR